MECDATDAEKSAPLPKEIIFALILLLAGSACTDTDASSGEHTCSLAGETAEAEQAQLPGVLSLEVDNAPACTATVIADDWLLTAAHCVYEKAESDVAVAIGVGDCKRRKVQALDIQIHDAFDLDDPREDLALVQVDDNLIMPLAIAPWRETSDEDAVELLTVGYGADPMQGLESVKRVGRILVSRGDDGWLHANEGPAYLCRGDSGAPLLRETDAGDLVVVGVASRGDFECQEARAVALTSSHIEWIESHISR